MKITVDLPDLHEVVMKAVDQAMIDSHSKLVAWKFFTLKETAELLQIKTSTLLDKRMPYLNEIEYSQNGKIFWFVKTSVEKFIDSRYIKKYRR
ncbi:MAG: hypothetical protein M3Q58_12300 [Bacteroidota bacterium]|nr:hypothetical protein [Bacteroidota bacterium]